jgi:hypothetical protein
MQEIAFGPLTYPGTVIKCNMSKNEKAYLVISVNEIKYLAKVAEQKRKAAKGTKTFCLVLRDLEIITDSNGNRQVCSWSVNNAIRKNQLT